jgi:hypothetical protein
MLRRGSLPALPERPANTSGQCMSAPFVAVAIADGLVQAGWLDFGQVFAVGVFGVGLLALAEVV